MARTTYTATVSHNGLGKTRVISGSNEYVVRQKAAALQEDWDELWRRRFAMQNEKDTKEARRQADLRQKQQSKEDQLAYKQAKSDEAEDRSQEALDTVDAIRGLLAHTLSVNDAVNWTSHKRKGKFLQLMPKMAVVAEPSYVATPAQPDRSDPVFVNLLEKASNLTQIPKRPSADDAEFQPKLGFLSGIFTSAKGRKELAKAASEAAMPQWEVRCAELAVSNEKLMQVQFEKAMTSWREDKRLADAKNEQLRKELDRKTDIAKADYERSFARYQTEKSAFELEQLEHNQKIDQQKVGYEALEPGAIYDYFDLVLNASNYPEELPRDWEMDFLEANRTLVVNYVLPSPSQMPTLKEVKYLSSKDEFKESHYTERETNALYDSALYQISLRTVHEVFESDYANALDAVVFNGIVHGIDKASGHNFTACVLSLQASKEEFLAIQLANIDPKACFKKLKGVGSSQLHGLSPVAPILQIDKSDSRFVDAYAVAGGIDESTNLASMDWEDFEHLVREVFEKEFRINGGEVRITQASRDGGVDAVAFDPDPIRGGKIVIQAKRYTNVVGVSAVRDLYGTVMNEGATKGILVTTASYGTDSYDFAKGKPLTLLDGGNLLHLLAKHGHKATIDIRAARAGQ